MSFAPLPASFVDQIGEFLLMHRLVGRGNTVVVGLSGGADSTVLALSLAALRVRLDFSLHAATVDHSMRPMDAELAFCEELCARLAVSWQPIRVAPKRVGGSWQAAARAARLCALEGIARELGGARGLVALAHTRTDQAETLLLRLLRGAGSRGLGAMSPKRGSFIRPLLNLSRTDIEAALRAADQPWCNDPSNESDAYLRNRLRQRLWAPLLSLNPSAERTLARTAEVLRQDAQTLAVLGERALNEAILSSGPGWLHLDTAPLQRQPGGLLPHILRQAARRLGNPPLQARHLNVLVEWVRAPQAGSRALDLPGIVAERLYGQLRLRAARERPENEFKLGAPRDDHFQGVELPGCGCFRLGSLIITVDRSANEKPETLAHVGAGGHGEKSRSNQEWWADASEIQWPLLLRRPREGERMAPLGASGSKKISRILINAKVPAHERADALVLVGATRGENEQQVLWLRGVRRSGHYLVGPNTREILRIRTWDALKIDDYE